MTDTSAFSAAADARERRTRTAREARLAAAASDAGLLDVAYAVLDSPAGPLLAAATPAGVVRIAFACEGHDAELERLAGEVSPRVLRAPARLDDVARQLDEYFEGRRHGFDLPMDLALVHGAFRCRVVQHLTRIPYGATESYGTIAGVLDRPGAARAVGTACARNPLPIVAACHRVVRGDGSVGQYAGGSDVKRMLLAMESGA